MEKPADRPPIHVRPRAQLDLATQAEYISRDDLKAALRYLEAADLTFQHLLQSPDLGNLCSFRAARAKGMKQWHVRGFRKHLVFYRAVDGGIEIVRVIHAARDIEAVFERDEF